MPQQYSRFLLHAFNDHLVVPVTIFLCPRVEMESSVAVPEHKLLESPNSKTITIGEWIITARTNPISNAQELDNIQNNLFGIPLPEMTFGKNSLALEHKASGWKYHFNTEDALRGVKNGELAEGDGGVKVGYADAWLQSR